MKGKAIVAMSGGVDSSVAAALMVEQGWKASGVTLKLLPRAETGFGCCGSPADIDDAKRVCEQLGIPHYILNLSDLFEDKVIKPFVDSYRRSQTPNPCVECNRSLKFGHLLALAQAWGAERLATGHYARAMEGRLLKPKDTNKDQTYFLYSLTSRELAMTDFPLGGLTKSEVRAKARALGLRTADKAESQEICFVPDRDYRAFVESRLTTAPEAGPIEDTLGRKIGEHDGLVSFTVGQRKGIKLRRASPEPVYVVGLKPESNTLVVGGERDVFSKGFTAEGVSWTAQEPSEPVRGEVRIRHRHPPAPALLTLLPGKRVRVDFSEPQRAVTPGQAAVFYRGEEVLGGGTITRAEGR